MLRDLNNLIPEQSYNNELVILFKSGRSRAVTTTLPVNTNPIAIENRPDPLGRFGQFGGKYVPETLMPALFELEEAYDRYRDRKSVV